MVPRSYNVPSSVPMLGTGSSSVNHRAWLRYKSAGKYSDKRNLLKSANHDKTPSTLFCTLAPLTSMHSKSPAQTD